MSSQNRARSVFSSLGWLSGDYLWMDGTALKIDTWGFLLAPNHGGALGGVLTGMLPMDGNGMWVLWSGKLQPKTQESNFRNCILRFFKCWLWRRNRTIHFQKSENVKNPVILNHGRKLRKVVIRWVFEILVFTCMIVGRVVWVCELSWYTQSLRHVFFLGKQIRATSAELEQIVGFSWVKSS